MNDDDTDAEWWRWLVMMMIINDEIWILNDYYGDNDVSCRWFCWMMRKNDKWWMMIDEWILGTVMMLSMVMIVMHYEYDNVVFDNDGCWTMKCGRWISDNYVDDDECMRNDDWLKWWWLMKMSLMMVNEWMVNDVWWMMDGDWRWWEMMHDEW